MKTCAGCHQEKDILEFRVMNTPSRPGYVNPRCRGCENAYNKSHYAKNRERLMVAQKNYKQTDKGRATRATWIANNKDRLKYARRKHHLRKTFGLTPHEFEQLKAKQFNRCAICKCEAYPMFIGGGVATDLHIDHCHTTKKIRGLLCHSCNALIGLAEENSTIFINAMKYLSEGGLDVSETDQSMRVARPDKRVQKRGEGSVPEGNICISAGT